MSTVLQLHQLRKRKGLMSLMAAASLKLVYIVERTEATWLHETDLLLLPRELE